MLIGYGLISLLIFFHLASLQKNVWVLPIPQHLNNNFSFAKTKTSISMLYKLMLLYISVVCLDAFGSPITGDLFEKPGDCNNSYQVYMSS